MNSWLRHIFTHIHVISPLLVLSVTYFRNLYGSHWACALCDEVVSAHYVPAVNMAEELLEAVEKLQSRLSESQEPRKLLKTLKRLGELPITVDILVETGVGKTVNSLRKHNIVGETAKDLVAKWKKLVPQSADRPSNTKEARSHSRTDKARGYKRTREPSPEQPPPVEEEEDEEEYQQGYSPSSPQHYNQQYSHRNLGGYQSEEYESPVDEPVPSPPQKQTGHSKAHREQTREHGSHSSRDQKRRNRPAQVPSEAQNRHDNREQKETTTHPSSKRSHHSSIQESRKEKKRVSDGREKRERPEPEQDDDEENSFEAPTMSFESFLTYDEPTHSKKKKKLSRPSQPVTPAASVSSKSSKANGTSFKRPESSTATVSTPTVPEKRKKVIPQIVDMVPTLPDIPLPAIQPNYRPLPSIDVTPLSPQRRKVPIAYEEEDAGFTGRRFNSKMVVYSGSKTSCLPKMMTLYEQCIRVLQNHIDSIDEVGGVPYEILEPVLERCTPEQLYRIEQCNQSFIEESDELWMRHCQRDFKRESPQEYESWRELYLRLHDEREERLRKLTQNISSAHANKPKGRQVKMAYVYSAAKPPRDVRRRQEKFGTKNGSTSTSVSAAAPIPVKIRSSIPHSSHSQSSDGGQSSYSSPPEPSHSHAPSSSAGHSSRDKPQVKKIAPMMAKTIKAFKNRFSRR
ncbi:elongin-A isoform X2 [Pangasianodon hypophthalmus]|uniref:elongin-A isoform X2 n=1 Tax=Pangasianodon hypophthalmus TaxID=310915 RepID=UPI0023073CBD|nr:elongin-A isoform X2 [Pangasianodon hypophthalmus]